MTAGDPRLAGWGTPQARASRVWFVFHEDGWVFFHRSWTGYCVYQVRFERIDDEYVAVESWVTRDSKEYNNNDIEKDVRQLSLLLHYRFGIGSEPCEE